MVQGNLLKATQLLALIPSVTLIPIPIKEHIHPFQGLLTSEVRGCISQPAVPRLRFQKVNCCVPKCLLF